MAEALRIVLFGPLRVEVHGRMIADSAWRSRHERRLLTALVLGRGATIPAATLIEWLWPAADTERAAITLRSAVSSLRSTLEPNGRRASERYILTQNGGYAWHTQGGAWIDMEVFLALLDALAADRDPGAIEQAVALYRGDLLEDDPEAPWAVAMRERLQEQFLTAVEQLATLRLHERRYTDAAALARRGIEHDHLREPLYRIQMQAAAYRGDVAAALQSYERFRLLLDHELGAAPATATQALHTAILRGEVDERHESSAVTRARRPAWRSEPGPPSRADDTLVGREGELAQLRGWLTALGQQRGGIVAVVGEAGIGKSHLLYAFRREAEQRGCQIISLRCEAIERGRPFASLTEALRPLVRQAPDALLTRLPRTAVAQVAELMPMLRERLPDLPELPPLGAADAHVRVAAGLLELALALTQFAPLLICCDDAQWADEALLATIGRLARVAHRNALLVVLAYRAEEVTDNPALHELLRALGRDMLLRPLLLGSLDDQQVAQWLAQQARVRSDLLRPLARRLVERSDGNALVIHVLIQSLLDAHHAPSLAALLPLLNQNEPLPDLSGVREIRDMISARLERLAAPVRLLAEQLALLARAASLDLVEQFGGEEALIAAQILLDRQFLVEQDDGRLAFAHDLVRTATVALIGGPRRRLLHRQIALALEQLHGTRPEYAAEITAHLQRSGRGSELRLVQYAVLAGRHAQDNLGYHEARRLFDIALQIAGQPGLYVPPELVEQAKQGMRRVGAVLDTPL